MFSYNNKISVRQLQILLILDVMGTGIITLPSRIAEHSGADAWISAIFATLFMLVSGYMITTVAAHHADKSFFKYSSQLLSRPLAVVVSVLFAAKLALMSAFELRLFGEILRQTMLKNTPFSVVCIAMLLLAAYAAAKGYETRARLAEVLIFVALVPLFIVFAIATTQVDFANLLPILQSRPDELAKGGYTALFSFTSIELCLLAFPYVSNTKKAKRAVLWVIVAIGLFMTAITAITVARFGVIDLKRQLWPVLEMMDTVDLPGSFIERQDALMLSFWIISVFAIVNACLFFSSLLLKDLSGGKLKHSTFILILIPIIFGLSYLPGDIAETQKYISWLNNTAGVFFMFILPFILLVLSKMKKPKILLAALAILLLTGCWDKIEIENRAFVVSLGIDKSDKQKEPFALSLSLPNVAAIADGNSEGETKAVKKTNSASLSNAMKLADNLSSQKLYFGQTKICVLGHDLLSDEKLMRQALDALDRNNEISKKLIMLATPKHASLILENKTSKEPLVGMFVSNYYKNNTNNVTHLRCDLEDLIKGMNENEGCAVIPQISLSDDELRLSGAAILKDFKLVGYTSDDTLLGLLLTTGKAEGSQITTIQEDATVPFTISKNNVKRNFYEADGKLCLDINIKAEGIVDEFSFGASELSDERTLEELEASFSKEIKEAAELSLKEFQLVHNADCYGFLSELHRKNPALYSKYFGAWKNDGFKKLSVNFSAELIIRSTGSTR